MEIPFDDALCSTLPSKSAPNQSNKEDTFLVEQEPLREKLEVLIAPPFSCPVLNLGK